MYLRTDEAKAIPSYVEVPRPNSSIIASEFGVAWSIILLVSYNYT